MTNAGQVDIAKIDEEMYELILLHLEGMNSNDIESVMGTIHPESPSRTTTEQMLGQMFNMFQIKNEIVSLRFIGVDDDYVYMRFQQSATRLDGPTDFKDNIADQIIACKMEGDSLKIWSVMPLSVDFIE